MKARLPMAVKALLLFVAACSGGPEGGASEEGLQGPAHAPPAPDDADTLDPRAPDGVSVAPKVTEDADAVTITNGLVTVVYDKKSGRSDYVFPSATPIRGAYASYALVGGGYVTSLSYEKHALGPVADVTDAEGKGIRVVLESTSPNEPILQQIVTMYEGSSYVFLEENVIAPTSIASNYLGAMIVDASGTVTPGAGADPRVLDVPFDNDEWVRWDSRKLGAYEFSGTSYEVTAVYESASRHGLVVGSVTHDFWKTGVYYQATKGRLKAMNVWGGVATADVAGTSGGTYGKDGTHDVAKHGAMSGTTLTSPRIFVGYFDDWRAGLESYGRANARIAPPKPWAGDVPVGWLSWGAFGSALTADKLIAVSDFMKANFGSSVYVNIDAGLPTDPAPVVQHIHANGQKAGHYRAPFIRSGANGNAELAKPIGNGTAFTVGDIVLRDDAGTPIRHHGAFVLDVTHPGTRVLLKAQIDSFVAAGFDYLKLDFLSDGAMEGKHYDPNIKTGIQAYNSAMAYLSQLIPANVFVSLSIAPIFPSQYGHARRIACDIVGQLNDLQAPTYPHYGSTEYSLSSLTYGWWMGGTIYRYNDPDETSLYMFQGEKQPIPEEWARTRVVSAAIAGGVFLDSTDYTSPVPAARAKALLGNDGIGKVARSGKPFRPLDGNTGYVSAPVSGSQSVNAGAAAADVFVQTNADGVMLAAFNFDHAAGKTTTIDLSRAGLDPNVTYDVVDVATGAAKGTAKGTLSVPLAAGQAALVKLTAK